MRRRLLDCLVAFTLFSSGVVATARASEGDPAPAVYSFETQVPALLRAADQALAGQRLVEAKGLLDRLESEPAWIEDARVKLLHAEWLIASDRPAEAWSRLEAIDEGSVPRCRVVSAKAIALLQLNELDRAEQLFADRQTACRDFPIFWRSLGRSHFVRGRFDAAVDALNIAAVLDPADDALQGDLAVVLIAAGKAADAVPLLTRLLTRQPDAAPLRLNLDHAHGMLGRRPSRGALDDDMFWSRRLQSAGLGAKRANRLALAEALLGLALIVRPRHDEQLWAQYAAMAGGGERQRH